MNQAGAGARVSPRAYSAELLAAFAGGEHESFLASGGRPLRPRTARALALAGLRPGLDLLDIGSGRGEASAHAARRGARVTALDWSMDGLDLVEASARALGSRVRRVAADAVRLPMASGTFDRVLLLDVIEHVLWWEAGAMLAEVRRILRPGGYVVIHTLPNRWALGFAYPLLRCTSPALPVEPRSGYERLVHVNEQDPIRLRRTLESAGLANRVWVEEWTTRHAMRAGSAIFPDAARAAGYPVLRRRGVRLASRLAMATPLRWVVANDIFALAWRPDGPPPPCGGRFHGERASRNR